MTSQIFTMAEAAAYFRKSRRWFQSFLRDNPDCYFMAGRSKLFDEADLQRIKSRLRDEHLDRHRRQIRFASRRGQFGTRTSGSALTELREPKRTLAVKALREIERQIECNQFAQPDEATLARFRRASSKRQGILITPSPQYLVIEAQYFFGDFPERADDSEP